MSDSITIRVDSAGYSSHVAQQDVVHVTTFWGGQDRGRMVQMTIGDKYVCMTRESAEAIGMVVQFASRNSIAKYPRMST